MKLSALQECWRFKEERRGQGIGVRDQELGVRVPLEGVFPDL